MKLNKLLVLLIFVFQSCANAVFDTSINIDELKNQNSQANSQANYKVKLGEKITFKTNVHGSVGMTAEYEILDDTILKLENSKIIYDNPNFKGSGGDGGMKKFAFKALSKGKTKVTIKKIYRRELQKEIVLEIEVI
ncbi:protease inhibitor I42 family protein [Bernardetia sp. OM2101]|uniref:protease inhibitor I42 family protein n=1 Tax=Bernardetia sp. OM2101 TaxID=3344876 RepID=UPI0035D0D3A6